MNNNNMIEILDLKEALEVYKDGEFYIFDTKKELNELRKLLWDIVRIVNDELLKRGV